MSCMFSQASAEDRVGVLLHRVPSGNRALIVNEIRGGLLSICYVHACRNNNNAVTLNPLLNEAEVQ